MRWRTVCWAAVLATSVLSACAATTERLPLPDPLDGIADGRSTREELLLRFGVPACEFEDGRILGFRVAWSGSGWAPISNRFDVGDPYVLPMAGTSLMFVLRPDGVVERHSAVGMR